MSFTRAYDDTCRVAERLADMNAQGQYNIDVPGNGPKPYYMEDPAIRLQRWGANLRTNCVNLESTLLGLGTPLGAGCSSKSDSLAESEGIGYPTCSAWSDETRATHPAWMYRDLEQVQYQWLYNDPQKNAESKWKIGQNTREAARLAHDAERCV